MGMRRRFPTKKYDPPDLVVVMDSSGLMTLSDRHRAAISAVRMLVNIIPDDNRVAEISFNTKAIAKTADAMGKSVLISLEEFTGVETVRDTMDAEEYHGDTGIGNAAKAATDLLEHFKMDLTSQLVLPVPII